MFLYDKDMERVMQHKKREILKELEETKCRILKELSGVDKVTLTRLREIIADYNRIEFNINNKMENFILRGEIVVDDVEKFAKLFETEIKQLDELSKGLHTLNRELKTVEGEKVNNEEFNEVIAELENSIANLNATKANKTDLTAPFNFKGATTFNDLPTTNNNVNDTYYCTDLKKRYTWNGSEWFQSSLDETEYADELSKLSEEIEDLSNMTYCNLANESQFVKGKYMEATGAVLENETYFYTNEIAVVGGENIYFNGKTRFITAFKNGVVSEGDGIANVLESGIYVVPRDVTSIVITSASMWLDGTYNIMVNRGDKLYDFVPYGMHIVKTENYEKEVVFTDRPQISTMGTMESGADLQCDINCIVKNKTIVFSANVEETFDSVVVGQGLGAYDGNALLIDNTRVQLVHYTPSSNVEGTFEHGLTITDFITVSIAVDNQRKASILISTANGGFTLTDIPWGGCISNPFARARNCTLTNGKLIYTCKDYVKNIWVFGDSYITTTAPTRFPYYLNELGIDNYLLDGFGGRNSAEALVSLKNALKHGTPKYLLWLLGMNDSDEINTSNSSWLECYNEVVSICKTKGITPIFARIPNVPNVTNWYKNRVIEYSGYRYIDFANAVGANEIGSRWHNGLLSDDGVHPNENGAKVLANQLLIDFPEITAE